MKLEKQVCSLELAKKLKELGFKQDSLFWWANNGYKPIFNQHPPFTEIDWIIVNNDYNSNKETIPAYLSSEIGEVLFNFSIGSKCPYCQLGKSRNNKILTYICAIDEYKQFEAKTLQDAMAKMLIYLLKNNLIKFLDNK